MCPLHKWLLATHLLCSSKKGMSAHQLHRMLGVTYKTAWFMAHRIREGMTPTNPGPMGGEGKALAQRGRTRPKRTGGSICRLLSVEGTRLKVRGLDAVDGTPVLDIKTVMRGFLRARNSPVADAFGPQPQADSGAIWTSQPRCGFCQPDKAG